MRSCYIFHVATARALCMSWNTHVAMLLSPRISRLDQFFGRKYYCGIKCSHIMVVFWCHVPPPSFPALILLISRTRRRYTGRKGTHFSISCSLLTLSFTSPIPIKGLVSGEGSWRRTKAFGRASETNCWGRQTTSFHDRAPNEIVLHPICFLALNFLGERNQGVAGTPGRNQRGSHWLDVWGWLGVVAELNICAAADFCILAGWSIS